MIDDLKRKAEAATPGKRQVDINGMRGKYTVWLPKEHEAKAADSDGVDGYSVSSANRDFIAACDPSTILRLVRVVEAASEHIESIGDYEHGDLVPMNRTRGTTAALRAAIAGLESEPKAEPK